jgi:hypothetical protein
VIPAIIYILSKPSGLSLITISVWAILPYIMILISTELGVAKFRFALLLQYIPASILAVYIFRLFLKKIPAGLSRYTITVAAGFFYLAYLVPSIPIMYGEWSEKMKQVDARMYITRDWINATEYLKKNAPIHSHIMVTETNGALLPAYAPVVTYVGNYMLTLDYESKKETSRLFFLGLLAPQDALNIVKNAGINYIFSGPEENQGEKILSYGVPLKKWFSNDTVTIYQIE